MARSATNGKSQYVMVRAYSGVFFGRLVERRGSEVDLEDVRHIYSWTSTGLARKAITVEDIALIGCGSGSRLSGACQRVTLLDVKLVASCSDDAIRILRELP